MPTAGRLSKISRYLNLFSTVVAYVLAVYLEVAVADIQGLPKFPGALYILLYLCCAPVPIWVEFSAITSPSRVTSAALEAGQAAYSGVRSAGWEAWVSVLGVYDRIRGSGS